MAPGKKAGGKAARDRRSNSRNSTPVSALSDTAPSTPLTTTSAGPATPVVPRETPYLHAPTATFISSPEVTLDGLIGQAGANKTGEPPSSRDLRLLLDRVSSTLLAPIAKRGEACERYLRAAVQKRKEREKAETERQAAEHAAKAAKAERENADDSDRKLKKLSKKRSRDEMMEDEVAIKAEERREREGVPSAVGAHGLARQDGVGVHEGTAPPPSPPVEPGTAAIDPMDTRPSTPSSAASDEEPPPMAPLYERAFGKDPTTCPDPTIYDIKPLYDGMPDDEKQAILNVAQWPGSDLRHMTAGDPPDMDFSNAKPSNQVSAGQFQTYLEPFVRAFTEEDVAYLKERGDRVTPYVIPARGTRTYREVWAGEDGMNGIEAPRRDELDPNFPRGSMEDMNDDAAETDELSMGPVMNRLMSLTRTQSNGARTNGTGADEAPAIDLNGDLNMTNGIDPMAEPLDPFDFSGGVPDITQQTQPTQIRPATALPADAPRVTTAPSIDYDTFESRALQELKFIGFVGPGDTPNFASLNDDEVAARLRTLQDELRKVSQRNNVRKALVLELTEERMAMQEYSNIADDLDNQVNAAYLKRNRNQVKPSHKKGAAAQARAGQKGVATGIVGSRGVSEGVRSLMQKRRDWIDMVGPVVGFGRAPIVADGETIFAPAALKRLEAAEREAEAESADAD